MPESESYSNPVDPSHNHYYTDDGEDEKPSRGSLSHLTNDDFRKLMMTPRHPSSAAVHAHQSTGTTNKSKPHESSSEANSNDPASLRKKKKSYYAQLKKEEEEREKELAQKYRDRAKERREVVTNDQDQSVEISTTANYRAVAPEIKMGENHAERRKQVIQESKYLGGDMEHTHLVKGLDYALLEKVKAEIVNKEQEEEIETIVKPKINEKISEETEEQMEFRTKLGRNIFRAVFRNKPQERNDLFLPSRMAYVVDLEEVDPMAENYSDIPTTLIRSKADCPSMESTTILTNNDIVINKLTQILSYLRHGRKDRKKKKDKGKQKIEEKVQIPLDEGIYGSHIDFVVPPSLPKFAKDNKSNAGTFKKIELLDKKKDTITNSSNNNNNNGSNNTVRKSYFEKPVEEEVDLSTVYSDSKLTAKEFVKNVNERFGKVGTMNSNFEPSDKVQQLQSKEEDRMKKIKSKTEIDSYAECYPGMMESADAIGDSDDEADYTKMDQGNKKGPVGRWDFDTQEEYSSYMSHREALPKAAFQYGVKMADGRKTRRAGPKDEKKELDREWTQIQNIISKRKPGQLSFEEASSSAPKQPKF